APTLVTAAVGLLTGDINTVNAILRPDYASGPGMTAPLGLLRDTADALRLGIVVANPKFFEKLGSSTALLIDGDEEYCWPASTALDRLRDQQDLLFGVMTSGSQGKANILAGRLRADFARGGLSSQQKSELVAALARQGHRVAFVSNCRQNEDAARLAHTAISPNSPLPERADMADAYLLGSDVSKLCELWELAGRQRQRSWRQAACTVVPNLMCIAGAFTLG